MAFSIVHAVHLAKGKGQAVQYLKVPPFGYHELPGMLANMKR